MTTEKIASNVTVSISNDGKWDTKTFDAVETEYLSACVGAARNAWTVHKTENDFNIIATIQVRPLTYDCLHSRPHYLLEIMTDNGDSKTVITAESKADLQSAFWSTVRAIEFTMDKVLDR